MNSKLRIYDIGKSILNPFLRDQTKFYLKTLYYGRKNKDLFKDTRTYCVFIGTGRTGHSLIASLLDAHPNVIISNELNTLKFILEGFRKYQLFFMILHNSQNQAKQGRVWTGYSYAVENQMQGDFTKILVIGDKKAGITSEIFLQEPDLLSQMIKKWKIDFKFIHVIRNPYDVITSMARGGQLKNQNVDDNLLEQNIQRFFKRMESVKIQMSLYRDLILEVKHEHFIENPKGNLQVILNFLNLNSNEKYLEDCSKIVKSSPSLSRTLIPWPEAFIDLVKKQSEKYPFLEGYTFDK